MTRRAFQPVVPREVGTLERAVSDLVDQAGGIQRVMVDLDASQSTVYAMTERKSAQPITLAQVASLTRPGVTAAAEWLAQLAGGVFLPLTPDIADVSSLCADDVRAHGEAVACLVAALKDGKLTPKEKREALEKLHAALRALSALLCVVANDLKPPG